MKNKLPKVSILIRCYNQAEFVEKAIQSVLIQTYQNLEIIILDNGSSDNSVALIQQFADRDSRIVFLKNSVNTGPLTPCNQILAVATGKYFAPLDADNYWLDPDKIKRQVRFMEKNPSYTLVGSYTEVVDRQGNHIRNAFFKSTDEDIRKRMLLANQFAWHTVLFKTDDLKSINGFKTCYPYSVDLELWLIFGLRGKLYNMPYISAAYRMTGTNTCEIHRPAQVREVLKIIRDYKSEYPYYHLAKAFFKLELLAYRISDHIPVMLRKVKDRLRIIKFRLVKVRSV